MTISASLTRIRRIAAMPLQRRRTQGSLGSLWFTIAFAMVVPVLFLIIGFDSREGRLVGGGALLVMGSVLLLGAWVMFFANLLEQAESSSVRLVPGFEHHLRLTLALGVLVVCAIEAVGVGLIFGPALDAALAALVLLTLVTIALRWLWLAGVVLVAGLVGSPVAFGESSLPRMLLAFVAHRAVAGPIAVVACIALLAIAAPSVRRPAREPRMPDLRDGTGVAGARAERDVVGREGQRPGAQDGPRAGLAAQRPSAFPDPLRRALAVLPLDLQVTFGWHSQWRHWLYLFAWTALLTIDALKDHVDLIFLLVAGQAVVIMAADVLGVRTGLGETRREQELMSMLPGVPIGPQLGRVLAMRLSVTYAMNLARGVIALALIRVAMLGSGAPLDWFTSPTALAALPLACVPMATLLWTNWATAAALRVSVFKGLAVLALLVGFAMLAPHLGWASLASVAVLYTVPTIAWCAWRWHRLGAEPTVLPAGRLGA